MTLAERLGPFGKMAADNVAAMLTRIAPDVTFVLILWPQGAPTAAGERLAFCPETTPAAEVNELLGYTSTAADAAARQRELETERDEAIADRNGHAEHVLRMAQECNDGLAALTEIDECWEACGLPGNRGKLSLSEQIASLSREGSADYERAEASSARVRELEEALRPFAAMVERYRDFPPEHDRVGIPTAWGHIRKAATLLAPKTGGDHE